MSSGAIKKAHCWCSSIMQLFIDFIVDIEITYSSAFSGKNRLDENAIHDLADHIAILFFKIICAMLCSTFATI